MKYMVMTTKHHEGFCLFDTKTTNYCAPKQGPGRDLVKEYVEAARAEGLRVGFYYSLMDWHHPDGARCAKTKPRVSLNTFTRTSVSCSPTTAKLTFSGTTCRGRSMSKAGSRSE